MLNQTHKQILETLLKENNSIVDTNQDVHVIFRSTRLLLVEGHKLRIGDIRLMSFSVKSMKTGLSDYQWNELLRKYQTLIGVIEYAREFNVQRLTD